MSKELPPCDIKRCINVAQENYHGIMLCSMHLVGMTNSSSPSLEELQEQARTTVLRPLADKFQELTRQIDSGEYKIPKTMEEAEAITEDYITQAWERLEKLIAEHHNRLLDSLISSGKPVLHVASEKDHTVYSEKPSLAVDVAILESKRLK